MKSEAESLPQLEDPQHVFCTGERALPDDKICWQISMSSVANFLTEAVVEKCRALERLQKPVSKVGCSPTAPLVRTEPHTPPDHRQIDLPDHALKLCAAC
jgi:hypothetical protein